MIERQIPVWVRIDRRIGSRNGGVYPAVIVGGLAERKGADGRTLYSAYRIVYLTDEREPIISVAVPTILTRRDDYDPVLDNPVLIAQIVASPNTFNEESTRCPSTGIVQAHDGCSTRPMRSTTLWTPVNWMTRKSTDAG